jgi:hypothetical protein
VGRGDTGYRLAVLALLVAALIGIATIPLGGQHRWWQPLIFWFVVLVAFLAAAELVLTSRMVRVSKAVVGTKVTRRLRTLSDRRWRATADPGDNTANWILRLRAPQSDGLGPFHRGADHDPYFDWKVECSVQPPKGAGQMKSGKLWRGRAEYAYPLEFGSQGPPARGPHLVIWRVQKPGARRWTVVLSTFHVDEGGAARRSPLGEGVARLRWWWVKDLPR